MTFIFLTAFVVFLFFTAIGLFLARSATKREIVNGPYAVAQSIRSTNRSAAAGWLVVLLILAFIEAMVPGYSFWLRGKMMSVQGPLETGVLLLNSGNGSVTWLFYVALFVAALIGLIAGSFAGTRGYPAASTIKPQHVI